MVPLCTFWATWFTCLVFLQSGHTRVYGKERMLGINKKIPLNFLTKCFPQWNFQIPKLLLILPIWESLRPNSGRNVLFLLSRVGICRRLRAMISEVTSTVRNLISKLILHWIKQRIKRTHCSIKIFKYIEISICLDFVINHSLNYDLKSQGVGYIFQEVSQVRSLLCHYTIYRNLICLKIVLLKCSE